MKDILRVFVLKRETKMAEDIRYMQIKGTEPPVFGKKGVQLDCLKVLRIQDNTYFEQFGVKATVFANKINIKYGQRIQFYAEFSDMDARLVQWEVVHFGQCVQVEIDGEFKWYSIEDVVEFDQTVVAPRVMFDFLDGATIAVGEKRPRPPPSEPAPAAAATAPEPVQKKGKKGAAGAAGAGQEQEKAPTWEVPRKSVEKNVTDLPASFRGAAVLDNEVSGYYKDAKTIIDVMEKSIIMPAKDDDDDDDDDGVEMEEKTVLTLKAPIECYGCYAAGTFAIAPATDNKVSIRLYILERETGHSPTAAYGYSSYMSAKTKDTKGAILAAKSVAVTDVCVFFATLTDNNEFALRYALAPISGTESGQRGWGLAKNPLLENLSIAQARVAGQVRYGRDDFPRALFQTTNMLAPEKFDRLLNTLQDKWKAYQTEPARRQLFQEWKNNPSQTYTILDAPEAPTGPVQPIIELYATTTRLAVFQRHAKRADIYSITIKEYGKQKQSITTAFIGSIEGCDAIGWYGPEELLCAGNGVIGIYDGRQMLALDATVQVKHVFAQKDGDIDVVVYVSQNGQDMSVYAGEQLLFQGAITTISQSFDCITAAVKNPGGASSTIYVIQNGENKGSFEHQYPEEVRGIAVGLAENPYQRTLLVTDEKGTTYRYTVGEAVDEEDDEYGDGGGEEEEDDGSVVIMDMGSCFTCDTKKKRLLQCTICRERVYCSSDCELKDATHACML